MNIPLKCISHISTPYLPTILLQIPHPTRGNMRLYRLWSQSWSVRPLLRRRKNMVDYSRHTLPILRTCSSSLVTSVIGISRIWLFNCRGTRFQYTYYNEQNRRLTYSTPQSTYISPPIYKAIETLDHEGMKRIESGNYDSFLSYLSQTSNTICGRYYLGYAQSNL